MSTSILDWSWQGEHVKPDQHALAAEVAVLQGKVASMQAIINQQRSATEDLENNLQVGMDKTCSGTSYTLGSTLQLSERLVCELIMEALKS